MALYLQATFSACWKHNVPYAIVSKSRIECTNIITSNTVFYYSRLFCVMAEQCPKKPVIWCIRVTSQLALWASVFESRSGREEQCEDCYSGWCCWLLMKNNIFLSQPRGVVERVDLKERLRLEWETLRVNSGPICQLKCCGSRKMDGLSFFLCHAFLFSFFFYTVFFLFHQTWCYIEPVKYLQQEIKVNILENCYFGRI